MNDLISRQEAIDLFESYIGLTMKADDAHHQILYILKSLPSVKPERKWTPVTEALPWNDTNVLVTVRDDSGDTPWEYTSVGWRIPDGQYWVVDNEMCYGVIAWMPLPEPWRCE